MSYVTGVVQDVKAKNVAGGKTAYDIVVGGEAYGAGLYRPKCNVGDYVKFELDDSRGYKNVARNSLKVSANKAPPEAVAQAKATAPKTNSAGNTVDAKQETISRQSALNSAIEWVKVLASAEALGLPATSKKGTKSEAMDTILAKYLQLFYEQNTGLKYTNIAPGAKESIDGDEEDADEEQEDVAADDDNWT